MACKPNLVAAWLSTSKSTSVNVMFALSWKQVYLFTILSFQKLLKWIVQKSGDLTFHKE